MNSMGMRPGIILLREGTDTSQVRRSALAWISRLLLLHLRAAPSSQWMMLPNSR
jgi:hypothetical protein